MMCAASQITQLPDYSITQSRDFPNTLWPCCRGLLADAFQDFSRSIQHSGKRVNLLFGGFLATLVNGFIDARDHHGRIPGVLAGGIDGMPEPRAVGKAFGQEQGA